MKNNFIQHIYTYCKHTHCIYIFKHNIHTIPLSSNDHSLAYGPNSSFISKAVINCSSLEAVPLRVVRDEFARPLWLRG